VVRRMKSKMISSIREPEIDVCAGRVRVDQRCPHHADCIVCCSRYASRHT
jgi:hypothetical protein